MRIIGRHCRDIAKGTKCRVWLVASLLMLNGFWAAVAQAESQITFNLKDAELQTVIATVAEFTGRNFIIDPRVKGKVTVISSKPMNANEVYQTFLSILEVHNFSAVPVDGVIKIVPSVNAKQLGGSEMFKRGAKGDEFVTRVIDVQNVSAAQLVPILRPLVPQHGHMAAYASTNVLIVSDSAANVDRLMSIIQRIDVASAADLEVMTLNHASAAEVVRIIESLTQRGKRADPKAASSRAVLVADERTNSILISGDKSERLSIRAIVSHLDTPLETSGNTHVIYLNHADAKELVPVLTGLGQTYEQAKKAVSGGGKGATQADRSPITVQAHEATNALVITSPPDLFKSLQSVIAKLDVRRGQVLVEAVIAEIGDEMNSELGVSWFVDGTADGKGAIAGTSFTGFNAAAGAGAINSDATITAPVPMSFLGVGKIGVGGTDVIALISAIEGDSRTNILSRPNIMTMDNEEAEIVVGQNVPFRTGTFTSTGSGSSPQDPFTTIERHDVGVTLKVKPQINEGNTIKLDIAQEVGSIAPSVEGAADITTNRRAITTTVLVDDGGTIVLGGLIEDDVQESEQKVPVLGDIPFVGGLFRHKETRKIKRNLLVFIRPTIVRDAVLSNLVTQRKYDYVRSEQLRFQEKGIQFVDDATLPLFPEEFMELPPAYAPWESEIPAKGSKSK